MVQHKTFSGSDKEMN